MKKIFTLILSVACAAMCAVTYASETNARLGRDIVRLHIIANSDAPEDQALKLKVRDRLLAMSARASAKADAAELLDAYEAAANV